MKDEILKIVLQSKILDFIIKCLKGTENKCFWNVTWTLRVALNFLFHSSKRFDFPKAHKKYLCFMASVCRIRSQQILIKSQMTVHGGQRIIIRPHLYKLPSEWNKNTQCLTTGFWRKRFNDMIAIIWGTRQIRLRSTCFVLQETQMALFHSSFEKAVNEARLKHIASGAN